MGTLCPYKIDKQFRHHGKEVPIVASVSGGRTSGLMLRMMLDAGLDPIILFANTGKERDETLDFVHALEINWGARVIWVEYRRVPSDVNKASLLKTERRAKNALKNPEMHWFIEVDYNTAARHQDTWGPFDEFTKWVKTLPNVTARSCTKMLKLLPVFQYLWSNGITEFVNAIGIRADEQDRASDIVNMGGRDCDIGYIFPLIEAGITEPDVMRFWSRQPFDLQLKPYEGNCHLCFLKKQRYRQQLVVEQPELAVWWKDQEDKKRALGINEGAQWKKGWQYSMDNMLKIANSGQMSIPMEFEDDNGPVMTCACTSGAFLNMDGEE